MCSLHSYQLKAAARLLFCVRPKLWLLPPSILAALVIAPLANYTFNGTRPCDVTYGVLIGSGYFACWFPILSAVFYTSVYQEKLKLSVIALLVVALIVPAALPSLGWMCDGYVFAWFYDLEPHMSMLFKLGQLSQQILGPPITALVFLLLHRSSCHPRVILILTLIVSITGLIFSRGLMLWIGQLLGTVLRLLMGTMFAAISLVGTCHGKCEVKSPDNSVYLYLGSSFMTSTLSTILPALVRMGNWASTLTFAAEATVGIILLFSLLEILVTQAFEVILRFGTVDREISAIMLSFPGLMFRLSYRLFFLTLSPFTTAWFLAALLNTMQAIISHGLLLEDARLWLVWHLKPTSKIRSLLEKKVFFKGDGLMTEFEKTELSAIKRLKVMFLLHILSADLVLFTSIACSMLIIVVLSLELFLLNLFPHVFIAPLWTYDPDASFSNKTNVKVILSFVVLLVLDIVAAYAVAILLNRRSLVWKVTDVFRRSSSKSLVAKIKRRLTRVSPTLTPVLPFSSPDVPTPTPKPATAGPATKGKRKILRAFSTQDHKLTLETGEEVDAAKMVSESNTLGMVHELNAFRWDLSQYVSAAYQRHMGTLLALWAFCVWQSLALTSEFIYFAKVLSSVLPKSNTTNMTDVDAFNDFMSNQTNSDYDLLRLVADTECFSGHHTCVLW